MARTSEKTAIQAIRLATAKVWSDIVELIRKKAKVQTGYCETVLNELIAAILRGEDQE